MHQSFRYFGHRESESLYAVFSLLWRFMNHKIVSVRQGWGSFFTGGTFWLPEEYCYGTCTNLKFWHPYRRPFGLNAHGKQSRIGVRAVAIFCLDIAFSWLYRGPDCLHGREFWMFFSPAFLLTSVWPAWIFTSTQSRYSLECLFLRHRTSEQLDTLASVI
jgi:hypothetical protein